MYQTIMLYLTNMYNYGKPIKNFKIILLFTFFTKKFEVAHTHSETHTSQLKKDNKLIKSEIDFYIHI